MCKFFIGLMVVVLGGSALADYRVNPYLQNPASDAMTLIWFSQGADDGSVRYAVGDGPVTVIDSPGTLAPALAYDTSEPGADPGVPYKHQVRLTNLQPNTCYDYTVTQGGIDKTASFKTAPTPGIFPASIRFIVYGDSETEPESTGKKVAWAPPASRPNGATAKYLIDQTVGYQQNLQVIKNRNPDFIAIAGDIVQAGGEQRDWDEFWKHNVGGDAGQYNNLASHIPIMAAPGNHEQYGGTAGNYDSESSNAAMDKYQTYFQGPPNHARNPAHEGRYYRQDYGPITLIFLDVTNGTTNNTRHDTNFFLDIATANSPGFNRGSEQYAWLETQLADAQKTSAFTFVVFHHVPYGSGPHSFPAGIGKNKDNQSGVPVRELTAMFLKYGVDVLLAGHDEMFERITVPGIEQIPPEKGGGTNHYELLAYDVGVGGDGLRGPAKGVDAALNAVGLGETRARYTKQFLAHHDSPEIWRNKKQLHDGGKHYGHLEVNITLNAQQQWQAILTPVYVFPLTNRHGYPTGTFERRTYDDQVTLISAMPAP